MSRTPRGVAALVALLVSLPLSLAAGLTAPLSAQASTTRATAAGHGSTRTFTAREARSILAKAQRSLTKGGATSAQGRTTHGVRRMGDLTMTLRDLSQARSSLSGADRVAADNLLARPTNGAGDDPVKYGRAHYRYHCFSGTVFCIHWVTTGPNAISTKDSNHDGIPNYVQYVVTTMKYVYKYETGTMGYRKPLKDTDTMHRYHGNPNSKYDIYLAELGSLGLYGYCATETRHVTAPPAQQPGYCVLDNNYAPSQYGVRNFLSPMRVTAAHEFFHDIQFAYDVNEDSWFMEGTATWMEDEVFDRINDNLQYLAYSPIRYPSLPVDFQTDIHRYGSWIFFKFASEFLHDRTIVRRMWEQADARAGNQYSLEAIVSAVSARHDWADFFTNFGLWDLLTPGTYSERSSYPAPVYRFTKTLSAAAPIGGGPTVLRHTSTAALRVLPDAHLPSGQVLNISVDAPDTSRGSTAVVQVRFRNGTVANTPIALDPTGLGGTTSSFDPATIASVVVLVANTSTAMRDCGTIAGSDGYEEYSCGGRGVYDNDSSFNVRFSLA